MMQNQTEGRLVDAANLFHQNDSSKTQQTTACDGKVLFIEPRTIRHQERVIDLFHILFRRA
ncbi:MAG: hypothetical protein N2Z22_11895 [Turneriella sp.]|nr:hypothetical protein [Turneriella sp.]